MECRTCSESLTALLDKELGPIERAALEKHLEACSECREEYESLAYSMRLLEASGVAAQLAAPRWANIESRISGRSGGFFDFRWLFEPSWTAAAALLLLALSLPFYFASTSEDADLERMLVAFVAERDRQEALHSGIIATEPVGWVSHNPFMERDEVLQRNPFSAE